MKVGTLVALGAALLAAATLTADAKGKPSSAACPHVGLLADTTRLTDFEGTTTVQFKATLGGEASQCVVKDRVVHLRLKFKVTGTLADGAKRDTRKVPYFVAVMQGSQVLAKQVYSVEIPFTGNARTVSVEERVKRVDIPISKGWASDDYEIMLGFQLTHQQVEYNRQNAGG
ncbi:MAG: hypothetical protein GC190_10955 [Alphaproteobacteria bacterium]|nr:hypothetical protein [Alphaproteobacteria bacterium]